MSQLRAALHAQHFQPKTLLSSRESRDQVFIQAKNRAREFRAEDSIKPELIHSHLLEGNFVAAIRYLHVLEDQSKGIRSEYIKLKFDGGEHEVLFRDAQPELKLANEKRYHNWAILGLNYLYAAKIAVELQRGELSRAEEEYINEQAIQFINLITSSADPEVELARLVHSVAVPFVASQIPVKKSRAEKLLVETRDFCNFDHPTMSTATLITVPIGPLFRTNDKEDKTFLQIDVPMTGGLSAAQQAQYARLADEKNDESRLQDIAWYQAQNTHIKLLIRKYAQAILDGHTIPTQLRKYLPGVRNAGHERIYDLDTDELVFEDHHAGTLGHELKVGAQAATAESIAQAHALCGAEHTVIISMLSPVTQGADKDLTKQMKAVVDQQEEKKIHFAGTPINGFRRVSSPDTDGLEFIYREALRTKAEYEQKEKARLAKELKEAEMGESDVVMDFRMDGTDSEHEHEIAELDREFGSENGESKSATPRSFRSRASVAGGDDSFSRASSFSSRDERVSFDIRPTVSERKTIKIPESKQKESSANKLAALSAAIEEYERVRSGSGWFDSENGNLSLATAAADMAHRINDLKGKQHIAVVMVCRSGKDRVGLARVKSSKDAIYNHITRDKPMPAVVLATQEQSVRHAVVQSGQVKKSAGMQGGTQGANGIKSDTEGGIPKSWDDGQAQLVEKTASYNKELPPEPGVNKLKVALGVLGVLIGIGLCLTVVGSAVGIPLLGGSVGGIAGVCAAGTVVTGGAAYSLNQDRKKHNRRKKLARSPYEDIESPEIPASPDVPTSPSQDDAQGVRSPLLEQKGHGTTVGRALTSLVGGDREVAADVLRAQRERQPVQSQSKRVSGGRNVQIQHQDTRAVNSESQAPVSRRFGKSGSEDKT